MSLNFQKSRLKIRSNLTWQIEHVLAAVATREQSKEAARLTKKRTTDRSGY